MKTNRSELIYFIIKTIFEVGVLGSLIYDFFLFFPNKVAILDLLLIIGTFPAFIYNLYRKIKKHELKGNGNDYIFIYIILIREYFEKVFIKYISDLFMFIMFFIGFAMYVSLAIRNIYLIKEEIDRTEENKLFMKVMKIETIKLCITFLLLVVRFNIM